MFNLKNVIKMAECAICKNKFQIVYIVDLVRAIEKIIFLSKKNNIFELTDNETYTYKEIYKFIAQKYVSF